MKRSSFIGFISWVASVGWIASAIAGPFPQGVLTPLGEGLDLPSAVAVDRARDRIFVTHVGDSSISYAPLASAGDASVWTNLALPAGLSLSQPEGVDVADNGDLYIADTGNGLAQRFAYDASTDSYTHDPNFPNTAPRSAAGTDIFRPRDIAIASDGAILLLDSGNGRILRAANADAESWDVWASSADWRDPGGLASAPDGSVLIADTGNHRIVRIEDGGRETSLGRYGLGIDGLRFPTDVAIDGDGKLLILDTHNNRLLRWEADGRYDAAFGRAPLFSNAQSITMSDGEIFIADLDKDHVLSFLLTTDDPPYDGYFRRFGSDDGADPAASGDGQTPIGMIVSVNEGLTAEDIAARGIENIGSEYAVDGAPHLVFVELRNRGTTTLPPGAVKLFTTRELVELAAGSFNPDTPFPEDWWSDPLAAIGSEDARNAAAILTPELAAASETADGNIILGPWRWSPDYEMGGSCEANTLLMVRHLNQFDEIDTVAVQAIDQQRASNDVALRRVRIFDPSCISGRDRYETNDRLAEPARATEEWLHLPARCPRIVTRGTDATYPETLCEGVFENGFAERAAEEIFLLTIPDLTLDSRYDHDVLRIPLPDLENPAYGLNDIYPGPLTEQMPECGVVQRVDPGPSGADRNSSVLITSTLVVEIVPKGPPDNSIAHQPIPDGDESEDQLLVYDPSDISAPIEGRDATTRRFVIDCPRSVENIGEVITSFGQRLFTGSRGPVGARILEDHGGYEVSASYIASIDRGDPGWATDPGITGEASRTRCFGARSFGAGGSVLGPVGGLGVLGGRFPFCGLTDPGRFIVVLPPPAAGLPCIADGPGCFDISYFDWAEHFGPLNLILVADAPIQVELIGPNGNVVAERELISGFSAGQYEDLAQTTPGDLVAGAGPNTVLYGASFYETDISDGFYGLRMKRETTPVSLIIAPPAFSQEPNGPKAKFNKQ